MFLNFLAYVTLGIPLGSIKKIEPIRSSRLAGYREHIDTNVLFHYTD